MSATAYSTLVGKIRIEGDDPYTGQLAFAETPQGVRDSANTLFRLTNPNVLTGTINGVATGPYFTFGTSVRQTTGFTLTDNLTGYVTLTSAPNTTTNPFFFDYRYLWFQDADYNTMIDTATEELGYAAGTATPEGLYPALVQFALDKYWQRRASQYAIRFSSSAGGASESVQTITQAFLALAKVARSKGNDLKNAYYQSFGDKLKPHSATITYGISPFTPRK